MLPGTLRPNTLRPNEKYRSAIIWHAEGLPLSHMNNAFRRFAGAVSLFSVVTVATVQAVPYFDAQFQQTDWNASLKVQLHDAPQDLAYWTLRVDGYNYDSVWYYDLESKSFFPNSVSDPASGIIGPEGEVGLPGEWFFSAGWHTVTVAFGFPDNDLWRVHDQQFQYEIILPEGPRPGVPDGGNTAGLMAAAIFMVVASRGYARAKS